MSDNVVHLPRPKKIRPKSDSLGLFFRPGHNQHKDVLEAMAAGKRGFSGLVVDAGNAPKRHRDLISHASEIGIDVILDPKTQAMGTPGGYTKSMAELPWGLARPHTADDFTGDAGRDNARRIAEFAKEHGCSEILGPTHLLSGPNDRWLRRDIENMGHLRDALNEEGASTQLIYPLAIPMDALRDPIRREALIAALADAPMDSLWLKVDNFGHDASGEKAVAYIRGVRAFHSLGVPVIADQVGGISSLSLLSFGAVGGIAQGITMLEKFTASRWKRPPREGRSSGGPQTRVYVPEADLMLKPREAESFIGSSSRTRSLFGCRDTHCCAGGLKDMIAKPVNHFMHKRIEEVTAISERPESVRVSDYLDKTVRPVSDNISAAVGLGAISPELRRKLEKRQKLMGGFREAIAHFAEVDSMPSKSTTPRLRGERER